jgi:IPT/TIG domain/PASTA domain
MRKLWSVVVLMSLVSAAAAASAQAAPVVVGSPLTAAVGGEGHCTEGGGCSSTVVKLAEPGAQVSSPINGTVARWRLMGASAGSGYNLSVLRADPGGTYTVTANSGPVTLAGGTLETVNVDLPILAGEFLTLNTPLGSRISLLKSPSTEMIFIPPLADGQTGSPFGEFPTSEELAFDAEVQAAPTITAIGTLSGPVSGGTTVSLSGTDFEGATAVRFGSASASTFAVGSEGQITAVSPAGPAGSVPISVTTVAGTATSSQQFTLQSPTPTPTPPPTCTVPELKGKSLRSSKRRIKGADCKVGKVAKRKGVKGRSGKVVGQSKKPGTVLPAGTVVKVTLGKG